MNTYIHYIRRNRIAHLRDRDICLRTIKDQFLRVVKDSKKPHDPGFYKKLITNFIDIERNIQKALLHANAAFNGMKKCEGNGEPESSESLIIEFLENLVLMCRCVLKALNNLAGLAKKNKNRKKLSDPLHKYLENVLDDAQASINFYLAAVGRRLNMLDALLASIE